MVRSCGCSRAGGCSLRPMSTETLKLAPAAWSPGEGGYLRSALVKSGLSSHLSAGGSRWFRAVCGIHGFWGSEWRRRVHPVANRIGSSRCGIGGGTLSPWPAIWSCPWSCPWSCLCSCPCWETVERKRTKLARLAEAPLLATCGMALERAAAPAPVTRLQDAQAPGSCGRRPVKGTRAKKGAEAPHAICPRCHSELHGTFSLDANNVGSRIACA